MSHVLVTGANGFVGRAVCEQLVAQGFAVRAAVRSAAALNALPADRGIEARITGGLHGAADWSDVLRGIEVVVHLAARVHVMAETSRDPEAAFQETNVAGTLRLAQQARAAGVQRFVFMSSIKVNGERTTSRPFHAEDPPAPADAYARSKRDAEAGLRTLAGPDFKVAIVRPPLVYGPGVGANFGRLMRLAASGMPLPFGSVRNARSLISVWNLADFVGRLVEAEAPVDDTWLICDGEDLSTPELIERMSRALGRPSRIFSVPPVILSAGAALLGAAAEIRRLTDSLQIDSRPARAVLKWTPKVSVDEALERTAIAWQGRARVR